MKISKKTHKYRKKDVQKYQKTRSTKKNKSRNSKKRNSKKRNNKRNSKSRFRQSRVKKGGIPFFPDTKNECRYFAGVHKDIDNNTLLRSYPDLHNRRLRGLRRRRRRCRRRP